LPLDQIRSERIQKATAASFPLISMCNSRLCNDLQACCTVTIFLFFSSHFLSLSSHLVLCLYPSPSPLSIPTFIACSHLHCSPLPSIACHHYHLPLSPLPYHINMPTLDANTPASTLLPVLICTFLNLQDRSLSPSPSLSVTWGTFPNLACRHHSALQCHGQMVQGGCGEADRSSPSVHY